MDLISVEELIKVLKENNINFGKGDPYNRLRYYTKIGLIPHMIRKKNSNNTNSGHYPKEVINKIIEIEKLKETGLSNEEILESFSIRPENNETNYLNLIKEKFTINYLILLLIIMGIFYEFYKSNMSQVSSINLRNSVNLDNNSISESGINFISAGQKKVFVPSKKVKEDSNVIVTFRGNIFPANNYFVSEIKEGLGFIVETNIEITNEVKFTWSIIN